MGVVNLRHRNSRAQAQLKLYTLSDHFTQIALFLLFEDKPLMLTSDFDTSATDDTTDDEDDTKSMRSRQVLAKRRLNLTPGLPEDTTYSMREFMHGKLILRVYKLGK